FCDRDGVLALEAPGEDEHDVAPAVSSGALGQRCYERARVGSQLPAFQLDAEIPTGDRIDERAPAGHEEHRRVGPRQRRRIDQAERSAADDRRPGRVAHRAYRWISREHDTTLTPSRLPMRVESQMERFSSGPLGALATGPKRAVKRLPERPAS